MQPQWHASFPDLPHEPQDLDLIRARLALTPTERVELLLQMYDFYVLARQARVLGPLLPRGA
jgi:hypothetical protein